MTETDTYREMAEEIARLVEAAERLQALGEEAEMPAVERNAKRLLGVAETLEDNVPEELAGE